MCLYFIFSIAFNVKIIKLLFCRDAGKCCWEKRVSELNVAVLQMWQFFTLKPAARSIDLLIHIVYPLSPYDIIGWITVCIDRKSCLDIWLA